LRSTSLDNRETHALGGLIDDCGLTDSVATTNKDRETGRDYRGKNGVKYSKRDSHSDFILIRVE
jgi:hypothetical protein